jgi:hypothetical protein
MPSRPHPGPQGPNPLARPQHLLLNACSPLLDLTFKTYFQMPQISYMSTFKPLPHQASNSLSLTSSTCRRSSFGCSLSMSTQCVFARNIVPESTQSPFLFLCFRCPPVLAVDTDLCPGRLCISCIDLNGSSGIDCRLQCEMVRDLAGPRTLPWNFLRDKVNQGPILTSIPLLKIR